MCRILGDFFRLLFFKKKFLFFLIRYLFVHNETASNNITTMVTDSAVGTRICTGTYTLKYIFIVFKTRELYCDQQLMDTRKLITGNTAKTAGESRNFSCEWFSMNLNKQRQ